MRRKASFPLRGSIYLIQFDPAFGHEIRKVRPGLVISNDHMNELAATVLVMPISSGRYLYYHWVTLHPPEGGLIKPSSIVTEQIKAVDKRRIRRRIGTVRAETMLKVEQAIRDHCGLPEGNIIP